MTANKLAEGKGKLLEETGRYISKTNDLLSGHFVVNSYTVKGMMQRHNRQLNEMEESRYDYGKYKSFVNVFNGTMMYLIDISAFIVIAVLLAKGQITAGVATATITYISEFSAPLRGVIDSLSAIKSVSGVKGKLLQEISDQRKSLGKIEGFRNIIFEHVNIVRGEFELQDFNQVFECGKKYAIIGESGSGKSTILQLLMKSVQLDVGLTFKNFRANLKKA